MSEPSAIEIRTTALAGDDRNNGAEVPGTEPPQMQIGQPVAFGLDGFAKILLQAPIGGHVEQDRPASLIRP